MGKVDVLRCRPHSDRAALSATMTGIFGGVQWSGTPVEGIELGEQVRLIGFHDEHVVGAAFLDEVGGVCALGVHGVRCAITPARSTVSSNGWKEVM